MNRFLTTICLATFFSICFSNVPAQERLIRVGVIGLDTSHSPAFAKILNDPDSKPDVAGCRVVCAYPHGSRDIVSSSSRIPKYTKQFEDMGIEIVDSIADLLGKVDCVLLETNDGRPHLEQAKKVIDAGKTVFIDKPIAGSIEDAIAIFEYAKKKNVPVFSSSSLRFMSGPQAVRQGKQGKVMGVTTHSPCSLEKTHPDLFWYGIHGVEILYTVMGPGCQTVTRSSSPDFDVVTGVWKDGRIATFRGIRAGKTGYGGTAFCEKGIVDLGSYGGYRPLLVEIVKFFKTGKPPVSAEETLELYAIMAAADVSNSKGGQPVSIESILK
ncbi:MAG: Gfo/Idh/MocA family oxidoreductase [Planctomycetota bacterium]|nr:Gfo/Idh/MocA family oxidoreductase [Planctomycetota bacterium]